MRATRTEPLPRAAASPLAARRERFGDYALAIMEHSGLSKCFPIIKSVPAVKQGSSANAHIPLGRPGSLCGRGRRMSLPRTKRQTSLSRDGAPGLSPVLSSAPGCLAAPHLWAVLNKDSQGTQGLGEGWGLERRMHQPLGSTSCCGPFTGAQRNEKLPVLYYSLMKSVGNKQFIGIEKIPNREACTQKGAVVNNV